MTIASLADRFDRALSLGANDKIEPGVFISATPYAWRDPSSIPLRPWVYGRQFLRGSVTLVVAPGATGKTALLGGTALALVTGRSFHDHQVWDRPQRVWLWNLEDSGEEVARLLQAAALHWRIGPDDIGDRLFVDSALDGAELKMAIEDHQGFKICRPVVEALVSELEARAIDVLVIDPFVSSHSVGENDNGAIDAIAKEWARIAVRANCAVVLVHHSKKMAGGEVNAESSRGASALVNAARSALVLNRMTTDEAKRYGIEGEAHRRYFRVYDDKPNRAPPADSSNWYQLASVALGNGVNGSDGDSLPVVLPWSPPDAFDGVSADDLYRVQLAVDGGEWKESAQAKNWVGIAVAETLGLSADKGSVADRAKINGLLRVWYANKALISIDRRDDGRREIKTFVKVGVWAVQGSAQPVQGWAGQGSAAVQSECPAQPAPRRGVGGQGGAGVEKKVGQGGNQPTAETRFPADNPALRPIDLEDDGGAGWVAPDKAPKF